MREFIETLTCQVAEEFDLDVSLQLTIRVIRGDPVNAFAMLSGYRFEFEYLISSRNNENSLKTASDVAFL